MSSRRIGLGFRRALAQAFLRISRYTWVPESPRPEGARIIVGAPHTSNWDFIFMLCIAWKEDLHPHWLGKKSLFRAGRGPIMRALGGIPVDRKNPSGLVQSLIIEMGRNPDLVIVIAPDGTRSAGTTWRSGFYRVARATGVPLTLGYVDRPTRTCGLGQTLQLTGNRSADMELIRTFYADKSGLRPSNRTTPRLRDESQ